MKQNVRIWLGATLVAACWPLNWGLPGARTAYLFFPLWLGYIFLVDGLVEKRTGTSLWTRSPGQFWFLFILSAPAWWLFELINWRTANWTYVGAELFTPLEYHVLCTIAFSTVMPAVFETAELARSFTWVQRFADGPRVMANRKMCVVLLATGVVTLAGLFFWPRYLYPFTWISLVLILEPVNCLLGRRSLFMDLKRGDWRLVIALSVGALICGVFWELWNFYSFPKWVYDTPGVRFFYIFEMPLLGYGGYVPFALELYALKNLFWRQEPVLAGAR